jgi:hypothetical protein
MSEIQKINKKIAAVRVAVDAVVSRGNVTSDERFNSLEWLFNEHRELAQRLEYQKSLQPACDITEASV